MKKRCVAWQNYNLQLFEILDYPKGLINLLLVDQNGELVRGRNNLIDVDSLPRKTLENKIIDPSRGVIDRHMTFDEYMSDEKIKDLREKMYD